MINLQNVIVLFAIKSCITIWDTSLLDRRWPKEGLNYEFIAFEVVT